MAVNVGHIASRVVVVAQRETPILSIAQLMRDNHVGAVIIIEDEPPLNRPIGIITDRDLVIEVLALELDYRAFTAGDIMTANPTTVRETDAVFDAFEQMQRSAVRRLPVVDATGRLVGIVAFDDLVELLAQELEELAKTVRHGGRREEKLRNARSSSATTTIDVTAPPPR
jgi:signal-transduction protein with cAMP-binding, CBS, and nucleotidyltransferase domain